MTNQRMDQLVITVSEDESLEFDQHCVRLLSSLNEAKRHGKINHTVLKTNDLLKPAFRLGMNVIGHRNYRELSSQLKMSEQARRKIAK